MTRFRQLSTARLPDAAYEQVRRDQAIAVGELQAAVQELEVAARPGRWQFIERLTARASIAELSFGGLDGDRDEEYLIRGLLVQPADSVGYTLRINGLEGTRSFRFDSRFTVAHSVGISSSSIVVAGALTSGETSFEGVFYARSRSRRRYEGVARMYGASEMIHWDVTGDWDDRDTPVVSLGVRRTSSTMEPGSWVELWRRAS